MFSVFTADDKFGPCIFFKFTVVSWNTQCAISQSTYFAVSYSGSLDRLFDRVKLSEACLKYSRKAAIIYTSIAWAMIIGNFAFSVYMLFFTGSDTNMSSLLAPITTHVNVSDLLIPRLIMCIFAMYIEASWIFPHTLSFMLATIFTRQYKMLGRSLERMLADSDERRLSGSDVETIRQRHQEISMSVSDTDDFLMFHNAGAFCCQLLNSILLLYELIIFRPTNDPVIVMMHAFWMFSGLLGLSITTAGGIMINHYVSTSANYMNVHKNIRFPIEHFFVE